MASNKSLIDLLKERYKTAENFLSEIPIAKAIGGVISNPTKQEVGTQVSNLFNTVSKGLDEVANDPMSGVNYSPIGLMTAFHGSPHKFDKFSLSKLGTGEGNAAYGVGGYAADAIKTGDKYRELLAGNDIFYKGKLVKYEQIRELPYAEKEALNEIDSFHGDIDGAIEYTKRVNENIRKQSPNYPPSEEKLNMLQKIKDENLVEYKPSGHLYKLDIPDKETMLDWDKPVSSLPEPIRVKIQEAFNDVGLPNAINMNPTGSSAYTWISAALQKGGKDIKGQLEASKLLDSKGIKGIKYLDAGSRNTGKYLYSEFERNGKKIFEVDSPYINTPLEFTSKESAQNYIKQQEALQTYNYVVFNDENIKVLKRGNTAEDFLDTP